MNNRKQIPQGYKDSPLGIIPKEWEVKRLGDIAIQIGDGIHGTPEYIDDSDYYFINGNNLCNGKIIITESTRCVSYSEFVKYKKNLTQDTILLSINGTIGNIALYNDENVMLGKSAAFITISNRKYFYYLLQSNRILVGFEKELTGSTIRNLSLDSIRNTKILLPPQTEIEGITKILYLWDTAIEKQSELIEKLTLRKRALMQQLFTGKKRLPGFSGEWKKRTYSSILTEVKRSLKWDEDELYKLISVRRRSEGLFFRESLYGRDIATKNLRPAKTGDFLISKMQIVHGASGLVTDEFDDAKISGSYISLISKDSNILDIRYYNLWSQMPIFYHQTFVSSFGVHIEKMTFDLDTFMSFGMPLPPIDEQHAIVSLIESVNKEIKLANEKLTNYQSQKRGLMQQLLTGKKRIK